MQSLEFKGNVKSTKVNVFGGALIAEYGHCIAVPGEAERSRQEGSTMKRATVGVLVILAMVGLTGPAQAMTTGALTCAWHDISQATYNWWDGTSWNSGLIINNGWATASWDPDPYGPPVRNLGIVWCVDLFNYSGTWWPTEQWTDADGAASYNAWVTPIGDGDDWRWSGGLDRASYLANYFGYQATTLGQKRALQIAIWTAAYALPAGDPGGLSRFQWVSGGGMDMTAYNTYMAAFTAGNTTSIHEWYDNNNSGNTFQDFINDVPEPTSIMLLGGALLGAALLRWRKRG